MVEPDSSDFMGKHWHLFLVLVLSNKKLQYVHKTMKMRVFIPDRTGFLDQYGSSHFSRLQYAKYRVDCNIFLLDKKLQI